MTLFEMRPDQRDVHRIVLRVEPEGTYILVFEGASSVFPERDYYQADLATAMRVCEEDYGVDEDAWVVRPIPTGLPIGLPG